MGKFGACGTEGLNDFLSQDHFARLRRCLDDRLAAFEILCGNSKMEEADELSQLDEEDPIPPNVLTQLKRGLVYFS